MEQEEWRVYLEGHYEVSNLGRVRTVTRPVNNRLGGKSIRKSIINKLTKDSKGYLTVQICKDGTNTITRVHRMVLKVFVGEPPPDYITDHRDGDKTNNRLTNLEWVTQKENIRRMLIRKTMKGKLLEVVDPFGFFPRMPENSLPVQGHEPAVPPTMPVYAATGGSVGQKSGGVTLALPSQRFWSWG